VLYAGPFSQNPRRTSADNFVFEPSQGGKVYSTLALPKISDFQTKISSKGLVTASQNSRSFGIPVGLQTPHNSIDLPQPNLSSLKEAARQQGNNKERSLQRAKLFCQNKETKRKQLANNSSNPGTKDQAFPPEQENL
jgi:hypothetical protein